jgi:hypothetical protein
MKEWLSIVSVIVTAIAASAFCADALADTVQPGMVAPPAIVKQMSASAPVQIGSVSVRPIPASAQGTRSTGSSQSTLVARSTDNLVGTSTNDLVVIYSNVEQIKSRAMALGGGISVKTYPDMGLTIVHAVSFDQLESAHQAIGQSYPSAKFDLPVRYFDIKPK